MPTWYVQVSREGDVSHALQGKPYGPKTDVWALGCILYELCSLRKAFPATNLGAVTLKILRCAAQSCAHMPHFMPRQAIAALTAPKPTIVGSVHYSDYHLFLIVRMYDYFGCPD